MSRLEVIEPAWRAIGAVRLQAQFDVAEANGVARLNRLDVSVAGDAPVLELTATGAAGFNLKDGRVQVGGAAVGELLRLRLPGLPLAWVRPFVSKAEVAGGLITGEIAVIAGKDRLMARTAAPLRVDALSVVHRGQPLLSKAGLSLEAEAVLTEQEVSGRVTNLTVTTPAGDALTAQAAITLPHSANPPVAVTAGYRADLPALLAPWLPLGRLKASGEADFTFTPEKIELRGLNAHVTDAGDRTLFKAAALRPFTFDLATQRAVTGGAGAADWLRITLGNLPLDRLRLAQPGAKLGGMVEQGEVVLAADGDRLTGRTTSPLKLAEVSLTQNGRAVLSGLSFEMQPSFELGSRASAKAESGEVTVRTVAGAVLLTLRGEASRTPEAGTRSSLAFNLEVPALSTQPLFAGAEAVTSGPGRAARWRRG
ncbi:MAG: hypothetical protein HYV75_10520 [Opitutae bacterium]|nr:hypothetical protein [Opitutae bacterium]